MNALQRCDALTWGALLPRVRGEPFGLMDRPDVLLTTSGRAALWLALDVLGLAPGARVLVPTYHCPSMLAPLRARGLAPLFYPLGSSGEPMLDAIAPALRSGVGAALVAHWFGRPQPLAAVRAWCDTHGIPLIEDCAHALFGRSDGHSVGTWGDLAIGSLTKFMPVSEGGCLAINRPGLTAPLLRPAPAVHTARMAWRMLEAGAAAGQLSGLSWLLAGRGAPRASAAASAPRTVEVELDSEAQLNATLAGQALAAPCRWVVRHHPGTAAASRRRQWQAYAVAFSGRARLRPLWPALIDDEVPYVFPLWVDDPDAGYFALRRAGIPVWRWDRTWPGTPEMESDVGRLWSRHVLQLACHPQLGEQHSAAVTDAVLRAYAG